jgi:hypothetical protein
MNMKQTLIRIGINAAACIFLLVLSVLSFNCIESPSSPVGPSSDVQLSVPLVDKTNLFGDFVKDTTFHVNSDGTISYVSTYIGQKKSVDTIPIQPQDDSRNTSIGKFIVYGFQKASNDFNISYFGINAGSLPSFLGTSFPIDSMYIDGTKDFDYIAIDTGSFTMAITNNLPIPIDIPTPIILRNRQNSQSMAAFNIPGTVQQGTTIKVISTSLAGKLLYGNMTVDPIQIHTNGSSTPVTFSSSDGITISYQPTSAIRADSASAIIPYQVFQSDSLSTFTLDDSVTIQNATFKSGNIALAIENQIDLTTQIHLEIPEIFNTQTQSMITYDSTFTSKGARVKNISLRDYFIETNGQVVLGTHLHYSLGITFISSGSLKKNVTKFDFVQARIVPQGNLYIQSVTGNFPTQYQTLNSSSKAIYHLGDIDKVTAQVRFKNMKVSVRLPISSGVVPFDYRNLVITAVNTKHHDSMTMPVTDGRIDPPPPVSVIDFTRSPNFDNFANYLVSYFPDLPDSFYVRGNLVINPNFIDHPTELYTIQDTSSITPYIDLNIPSEMSISNGHIRETQDIQGKIPKEFTRSVKNGMISFMFTNGIPFVMSSNIGFLGVNVSTGKRDTLISFNSLGPIASAHLGADSLTDSPVVSNVKIYLTGDQIDKVNQADSLAIRLNLATGNNGAIVKIRNTDAIRVQGSVNARYTINKP